MRPYPAIVQYTYEHICHPERSEGSFVGCIVKILRYAQNDKLNPCYPKKHRKSPICIYYLCNNSDIKGDFMKKMRYMLLMLVIIFNALVMPTEGYCTELSVSAQSAILIEKESGRVLYSKNSAERMPMASTTKIMTAICALEEEENIDRTVEISSSAAGVEGSSMYLEKGEKMTMRELLYGLMLSSGNDAAVAIAEEISESCEEFAKLMNKKAEEIGLYNTNFTNPNGLPGNNHYSTAGDMATLAAYGLSNPEFLGIVSTKSYKIAGEGKAYPRVLSNHNKLLSMYDGCIGVKTGFTKAAGRCLVSAAKKDGMTLIAVTLNAPNDWSDHAAMLDFGFANYKYTPLALADEPVSSVEIVGSYAEMTPVYPERDVYFPLKEGENVVCEIEIYPEISAPVSRGETVGKMTLRLDRGEIKNTELISGEDVRLVIRSDVATVNMAKKRREILKENIAKAFKKWLLFLTEQKDC